jgi:putative ABC transport system ATP-binding protein
MTQTAPADGELTSLPAARVRNLTKTYGEGAALVTALDDVTLDLTAGEFTAVMGPSGSGKSTLMHCCAALDRADSGEVWIGDQELTRLKDKALTRLRRDQVGFVFQSFNLVPTLSAEENILLPLSIAGRRPDPEWYETVISTVGLRDRLSHRPNALSGGQQQRVAVARAIVTEPVLLLADEPTGALDSHSTDEVLRLFDELSAGGRTVVVITHEAEVASHAKRVIRMSDGTIVSDVRSVPVTSAPPLWTGRQVSA